MPELGTYGSVGALGGNSQGDPAWNPENPRFWHGLYLQSHRWQFRIGAVPQEATFGINPPAIVIHCAVGMVPGDLWKAVNPSKS